MISSQKPYLIRAIFEWCEDNSFSPYLVTHVDAKTLVPEEYIENNQIVLDISSSCTKNLFIDNEWITFRATFSGIGRDIAIPIGNVLAIFAKENGQGMQFQIETAVNPVVNNRGGLKLVK